MKNKKPRMNSRNNERLFFFAVGLVIGTLFLTKLPQNYDRSNWISASQSNDPFLFAYRLLSQNTSCDGVEYFYTNDSFGTDLYNMQKEYDIIYNSDEYNTFPPKRIYEPKIIRKGGVNGYDCDDFAHAIKCLAKEYNLPCYYYLDREGEHLGICCWYGEWVCR